LVINMPYKYATKVTDYSDFASGRVFYSLPGMPAFPIRLIAEIFQRARAALPPDSNINIYDPTCGGAYHLTALAILYGSSIRSIFASDINDTAVNLARRNLELLSESGLNQREVEIRSLLEEYGKESHWEAVHSVETMRERMTGIPAIKTRVFRANVFNPLEIEQGLRGEKIDLVFADVPYGHLSSWSLPKWDNSPASSSAIWIMLESLLSVLPEHAVVAIAADKSQKIVHENYRQIERFKIGRRQIRLLNPMKRD
jgi:23S rRNA (guanine2535-N1)-methyltransferase